MPAELHIDEARLKLFERLDLLSGGHQPPTEDGDCKACLMEARAFVYRRDWSDHDPMDSLVIGGFLRSINDSWPHADRQWLKKYLSIPPTRASVEVETKRAVKCLDWMMRVHRPMWLEAAGLVEHAATMRALPEVVDPPTAAKALAAQGEAIKAAWAAWAAWAARDARAARAAWAACGAWAAWAARDARAARAAWAAWAAWAARAAWAACGAWAAWAAWAACPFLITARAGDALAKDATEQQRKEAGIAALNALARHVRESELALLDELIAMVDQ